MEKKICPICNKEPIYRKEKWVKDGYRVEYLPGRFRFITTGKRLAIRKWWSCKSCADAMKPKEYMDMYIKLFNNYDK